MKKILSALTALLMLLVGSAQAQEQVPQSIQQMQMTFAPLVKKTSPSVVNIYAKVKVTRQVINPLFADPFFNQFFGRGMGGQVQERLENSLGSGVIVDSSGLIATNTHVIRNATEIIAVTSDGREFSAEKVLDDPKTDLAILKINPKGEKLTALEMADSDALEVGDIVLAIGNPFGVGQTVSSGIISALARTVSGPGEYSFFIQTDAAINPGNSGGALIDMQGRLIGINSMIFSKDGGSLGIGFAIPSNMLKTVVDASRSGGKLIRPWTGVTGQPVTSDMIESLGLKRAQGALISKVHPKSPAARAGVQAGDVILTMDGKEIQDPQAMRFRMAMLPLGTDVKLNVLRAGKELELIMKTGSAPEDPPRDESLLDGASPLSGAVVANLSPAVADEIGGVPTENGVVVMRAEKGNAARLGLRQGDIVLSINGINISSVAELKKTLQEKARAWQVQIQRGQQVLNLIVRM